MDDFLKIQQKKHLDFPRMYMKDEKDDSTTRKVTRQWLSERSTLSFVCHSNKGTNGVGSGFRMNGLVLISNTPFAPISHVGLIILLFFGVMKSHYPLNSLLFPFHPITHQPG